MSVKQHRLRKRAEELLEKRPENLSEPLKPDVQKLIHELQVHQMELEMQNEELRQAQAELEESRNRYADLYDFAPVGYFTLDRNKVIKEVNLTGATLLGVERRYLVNRLFSRYVAQENRNDLHLYLRTLSESTTKRSCELNVLKKDGTTFYAQLGATAVFGADEKLEHFRIAMLDVSKHKQAEELKISLGEKEVLLKEIHHRVKNNLQIISSLLNLQSRYITDQQSREKFKESQNRIKSMALVHEKLYQSENFVGINFREYIRSLASHLIRSYATGSNIKLNVDVDNVSLNIDKAIPCGLIVNELVSNSLKSAFPPEAMGGEIRILLHPCSELSNDPEEGKRRNKLMLAIGNNGTPFPEDVDFRNTQSLGLQLVCNLVDQLKGTMELDRSGGTEFRIRFSP
ncbi:MAG TPA: histidine kinase dimerization/phosphoacceptor domain -containing protein [Thermodesulfobacteriota bacterium]|nr:histidine kinase dimerization/phosphoacceptor domain -containing protein [Thermodesulfobacteriota bacterium]